MTHREKIGCMTEMKEDEEHKRVCKGGNDE